MGHAASVIRESEETERELSRCRSECEQIQGDSVNHLKGMQDAQKAKGALATHEHMQRKFALSENESLQEQTRALRATLAKVRGEAQSAEEETSAAMRESNSEQNVLNETLVAAQADAVFLRRQLARTERKLHFHECES